MKGLLFTVQKALPLLPDGASIILGASIVASKRDRESVVFLASDDRSYITGTELFVDGGMAQV